MNSARWFMRREDFEPKRTHPDSPFRNFVVKCLRCESVKLNVAIEFDESEGSPVVIIQCCKCRQIEKIIVR